MSPKNKGKFGKAKVTAIPETDEFISGIDRILRAVKPHALQLGIFAGIVVVVVLGYTTWKWWQNRQLSAASSIYERALELSQVPVHPPEPAATAKPGEKPAVKPPEKKAARRDHDPRDLPVEYASAAERARAVLATLEELSADYASTGVAHQALLLQAESLYELGRFAESAERYRQYADGGGQEDLVLSAREGLGYALEAQANAEKDPKAQQAGRERALKAFQDMQPKPEGPRHDEALYHQARLQAELGRRDDAQKTFEKVLVDHPSSMLKQTVEMRMAALRAGSPAK